MNVKRDVHTLREFIERSRPYVSKTVADQWEVEFDVLYKIVNHGSLSGGVSSVVGKLGNARSS